MTAATNVKILAESYYSKLWVGDGTAPTEFTDPVAKDVSYTAAVVASGYEAYTTTGDYVGEYIATQRPGEDIGTFVEVSSTNKDSLDITPGTTHAYSSQDLRSGADVSSFVSTSDYVGKYIIIPPTPVYGAFVEVTSGNKDSLGIIPGVTVAYTSQITMTETAVEITPQLGWCYVDASTGDFYIYDGSTWADTGAQWSGTFL